MAYQCLSYGRVALTSWLPSESLAQEEAKKTDHNNNLYTNRQHRRAGIQQKGASHEQQNDAARLHRSNTERTSDLGR